jgi:hypothetical protein
VVPSCRLLEVRFGPRSASGDRLLFISNQRPMNAKPQQGSAELDGMDPPLLMAAGIPAPGPPVRSGQWEPPAPEELAAAIPGYLITEFLGRGGMGAVYKGMQLSLDRSVAVKVLAAHLAENPEFEVRFQREARAMARLNHPNIVQVYEYGRTDSGYHYLIMEYVDGSDLSKLVRTGGLDAGDALNAVSQICAALQYAHELGFVHRDIKPANVFITQQGILKVGDFGLAKIMDGTEGDAAASEDITLTQPGAIMGTPSYAAPEQLGGAPVDHRADLYSLGVMFYEMLTREIPRGAPRPPSRRVAALDVRIDGVVFKALEADPGERYQSADDLRTDVDIIRTTPHQKTETPSAPSTAAPPAIFADDLAATTRSLGTTRLVFGLIALCTLAGLAFFLAQRKTGDTVTSETTITNSITHNNYFTQLIASGVTTAADLESIGDIRPFGSGFIGISRAPLLWTDAVALAARTGSEILPLDPLSGESRKQLLSSLSAHITLGLWVKENGTASILTDTVSRRPTGSDSIMRAVFLWQPDEAGAPPETERPLKQGGTKPKLDADAKFKKPEFITEEVRKKNLLVDPGVERSDFILWKRDRYGYGNPERKLSFQCDTQSKREGNQSLSLANSDGSHLAYYQTVPVTKGRRFLLTGWIKTEKVISTSDEPKGGARLVIDWWDETSIIDGDSDWTFVSVVAVAKKEQLPIRCVLTRAKGKAYFDDLVLIELPLEGSVSSPPLLHPPPTPAPEPEPVSPPTVQTPLLPTDWTNKDGKSIRARFLRLGGEAVVVEMNGKEFTIPFSNLTPASVLQARHLQAISVPPAAIAAVSAVTHTASLPPPQATLPRASIPESSNTKLSRLREVVEKILSINPGGVKLNIDGRVVADVPSPLPSGGFDLDEIVVTGENSNDITDEDLDKFAGGFAARAITLHNASISRLDGIAPHRKLQRFFANGTAITDKALVAFKGMKELQSLNLDSSEVTGSGLANLTSCPKLTALSLHNTPLTDEAMPHIGACRALTFLNLGWTAITTQGLAHLASLNRLETLSIDRLTIGTGGLDFLASLKQLNSLDLATSQLDSAAWPKVGNNLGLITLNLVSTKIGTALLSDRDLQVLAPLRNLRILFISSTDVLGIGFASMSQCKKLEALTIEGESMLTDEGLGIAVKSFPSLTQLGFSGTITAASMPFLANLKRLRTLQLSGNSISDSAINAIPILGGLEVLRLDCPSVTSTVAAALARQVTLSHLEIKGTAMDDKCVEILCKMGNLKKLAIGPAITSEGEKRLRVGLPKCSISR